MGFDTLDRNGALKVANSLGSFTSTTTGNIDNLDFNNASLIRMNNAALSTIRGLKAGVDGQEVTIVSIGAGQVNLAHQNAGSTVANRLINLVTGTDTPLAAGNGRATYKYDLSTARWRLVDHDQGSYINIAYAAGNFTASAGTWTVQASDQLTFKYQLRGKSLLFEWVIVNTDVSNAGVQLRIAMPTGFTQVDYGEGLHRTTDAGTPQVISFGRVGIVGAQIELFATPAGGGYGIAAANNTTTIGSIEYEVV